jgi:hypothetical protein
MTLSLEAHDQTLWATGNAWAVAGAARVIATMRASPFADDLSSEMADIQSWAAEIFEAARPHITDKGLLRNHINDSSSFEDSAASALVAAAGLRFSTMNLTNDYVDMSLTLLGGASRNVNSSGYLNHVVNPMTFVNETTESPEGQSFMILAYAAYNDWDKAGRPGNTKTGSDPLAGAASPGAALGVPAILAAAALAYVLV